MKSEGWSRVEKIQRFLKWNFLRPTQRLVRGWAYSDLWDLYFRLAKSVYPRLKAYVNEYRKGRFAGMHPGMVLAEFKKQLIAEGYEWDEGRCAFKAESDADERLQQLWLGSTLH